MATQRITKRVLDSLAPGAKDRFVWDTDLAGFGAKQTPKGRIVFIAQYRVAGLGRRSTTKRLTLGEYGTLTPEEARRLAKRELGGVAQGLDPADSRSAQKGVATVRELGKKYLESVHARRKETTAREYERMWEKHILPELGSCVFR